MTAKKLMSQKYHQRVSRPTETTGLHSVPRERSPFLSPLRAKLVGSPEEANFNGRLDDIDIVLAFNRDHNHTARRISKLQYRILTLKNER
jgi:hypothetical protein